MLGASRRSPSTRDHSRHTPHRTPASRLLAARASRRRAATSRLVRQSSPLIIPGARAETRARGGLTCARGRMVDGPESYESSQASVWLSVVYI